MFARVTKFRMKPGSIDAAKAKLATMKEQIMALPGLVQMLNVVDDNGNGFVISIVENEALSDANQDKVQAIWSAFAEHLAEPPTAGAFQILMNETNA